MISFSGIHKQYGKQLVFVDASFQLNPGEKVGLVGPNGAGKTTLFRMIVGEEDPDEGDVSLPKRITVGYFRQDVEEMSGRSVLDEAIAGSGRVGDLHHELESLQQAMLAKEQRFIERFAAHAAKAAQVQSRVKALEKIEKIELPKKRAVVKFDFKQPARSGDQVVALEGVHKAYGK